MMSHMRIPALGWAAAVARAERYPDAIVAKPSAIGGSSAALSTMLKTRSKKSKVLRILETQVRGQVEAELNLVIHCCRYQQIYPA